MSSARIEGINGVSWFAGVPTELNIAGTRFWMAGEALEDQDRRLDPADDLFSESGVRPETDWAATGLFLLARVQLDQMVDILQSEFGIHVPAFSGAEVERRLRECFEESDDDPDWQYASFGISVIGEGVDLWRALQAGEGGAVGHGFAVDGSISITSGPEIPELRALGLRGGYAGELNDSPLEVLACASTCTHEAAALAVRRQLNRRSEGSTDASVKDEMPAAEPVGTAEEWRAIKNRVVGHFSIWWEASEYAFVDWAVDFLRSAGLVGGTDETSRARAAARLMSLWAVYVEFAAYSGEGAVGDWRYDLADWVDDGITAEQLRMLNLADELGWDFEDDDVEIHLTEVCASVVEHYYREVVDALKKDLGDSYSFAHFWAARFDDATYPLDAEVVGEIVNDESVLSDDPEDKLPTFGWVQSGMYL